MNERIDSQWSFSFDAEEYKVKVPSNRGSNDAELVKRWCLAGKGIANKSSLDFSQELLTGSLVRLLPSFQSTPTQLWLVCPSRQSITPAVRLLKDCLQNKCNDVYMRLSSNNITF